MKKKMIGVVVAVELEAVLIKYGQPAETIEERGYTVRIYNNDRFDMAVVDSGAGEIAAAAATQYLIDRFAVDMILNFGAVGALSDKMSTAELCVVTSVIHYDMDTSGWLNLPRGQHPGWDCVYLETTKELADKVLELEPTMIPAVCASADKFVDRALDKLTLRQNYKADICEMELAGVLYTCRRNGVPCLSIKAISDSLVGGGREFMAELRRVSLICFDVVDRLLGYLV